MNKMSPITSPDQLVGGQHYIRAFINYLGEHWVETYRIDGKPFRIKSKWSDFGSKEVVHVMDPRRSCPIYDYYLTDLGVYNVRYTRLYPFSSKLLLKLNELAKDKRKFVEFLQGYTLSDEEWGIVQGQWRFEAYMDSIKGY